MTVIKVINGDINMSNVAILGHATRGKEVIEILEMLGGINTHNLYGDENYAYYTIDSDKEIKAGIYVFGDEELLSFTLEEFLEKYPYKVGDKVTLDKWPCTITGMSWEYDDIIYYVQGVDFSKGVYSKDKDLQPYKETMEDQYLNPKANSIAEKIKQETKKVKEFFESKMNLTIQDIRDNNAEWLLNKLREMSADGALQTISDLYDELHKPQYPQTYEKCCEIIGAQPNRHYFYTIRDKHDYPHEVAIMRCLDNLRQLLICRDAYLKIAVEQIGEPWEPNWTISETKFTIVECAGIVVKSIDMCNKRILAFPTEEMRDAFYENFKELIEQCKELL